MQFADTFDPAVNGFGVLLCILQALHFYLLLKSEDTNRGSVLWRFGAFLPSLCSLLINRAFSLS